jgi:two-component system sensor histidine kinase DctS
VIKSVQGFVRRREQSREPVAVGSLLDAVLPLVRLQARKSGTRIDLELTDPQARVLADRTMIEQVLLNLARNAIQAMEIDTPAERRVLRLRAEVAHGKWMAFRVIDAGPGIAPDIARRLFTPFFTTRDEGMGLGLSLCRTVVEQHGGALDFDTRAPGADGAGGGTEFRFTLPLAEAVLAQSAPA